MNFAVAATAASIAVLGFAAAAPAFASDGPEVRIRHSVARMVVVVEDRADVAVEIEGGTSGLPRPTVTRVRNEIRIDGGLGRNATRNCRTFNSGSSSQPGEGASIEVRGRGRVDLSAAPLIVVRTPRHVSVNVESDAVFGAVGRGAQSVELSNNGCGSWTVANVAGPLSVSISGSGDIRAGTSGKLEANIMGSGDLWAGATGDIEANIMGSGDMNLGAGQRLDANIMGSGDLNVAAINGPLSANIPGSGNITVRGGQAANVSANVMGSGDIDLQGQAGSVSANIMGSGDIHIARVTGAVNQSTMGSGRVRIGG